MALKLKTPQYSSTILDVAHQQQQEATARYPNIRYILYNPSWHNEYKKKVDDDDILDWLFVKFVFLIFKVAEEIKIYLPYMLTFDPVPKRLRRNPKDQDTTKYKESKIVWQKITREIRGVLPHMGKGLMRIHGTYNILSYDGFHWEQPLVCCSIAMKFITMRCIVAFGFVNGSIRLFDTSTRVHIATCGALVIDNELHPFEKAVVGILIEDQQLIYGCRDDTVMLCNIEDALQQQAAGNYESQLIRAGNLANDGAMLDFSGNAGKWVGLFAGIQNRSIIIWRREEMQEVVYAGGELMNNIPETPETILTALGIPLGRLVQLSNRAMLASTRYGMATYDTREATMVSEAYNQNLVLGSIHTCQPFTVTIEEGNVLVLRETTRSPLNPVQFRELCRFEVNGNSSQVTRACLLRKKAVIFRENGTIEIWDTRLQDFMNKLDENVRHLTALTSISDEYMAAASMDGRLHIWSFKS